MPGPKLFTTEWAAAAAEAEPAHAAIVRAGFKDAGSFTHVLALQATDLDREIYVDYVSGNVVSITDTMDEARVWSRFVGTADTWKQAAEGTQPAANLVMGAKLKLTKGEISELVQNAEAFNRLNRAFGDIADVEYSA
jgi:hypothetical protein